VKNAIYIVIDAGFGDVLLISGPVTQPLTQLLVLHITDTGLGDSALEFGSVQSLHVNLPPAHPKRQRPVY